MPAYLVETYLARGETGERAARDRRARAAAEQVGRGRDGVRFERSIHVLEDEICFYLFVAPSSRAAAHTAARAGLNAIRVLEAIPSGQDMTGGVSV